ncbi:MAG: hypothetical protein ACI3WR_05165 [Oscillospiraceae bacterium]
MKDSIKTAFDPIRAPERLKRETRAYVCRKTFDYGRNTLQRRRCRSRLTGCLAAMVLLLAGAGLWFLPAASIGLDINPSIELQVNVLDRVIALQGLNEDGRALAQQVSVAGMPYDEAMQRILLSDGLAPYLDGGSMIAITVVGGGSEAHAETMLGKVVCRAYALAEEENVLYCQADRETVRAARAAGLCIPRYLAWQELLKTDPDITVEDAALLPKEDIRALVQQKTAGNFCRE